MEYLVFKNYDELISSINTNIEAYAYVENEQKIYKKNEHGEWENININQESNLKMTAYDINKQIIKQMKPMKRKDIEKKYGLIEDFRRETNNNYYLLYGKEISYFTLFVKDSLTKASISIEIMECLYNIGDIFSIDLTETKDAIEIWVRPTNLDEVTCLYFFPYDTGIVPYNGG